MTARVYFRKVTRGGKSHIQGGNMKTHVAVYEEGLFDVRGGGAKPFLRGGKYPLCPPPKKKP